MFVPTYWYRRVVSRGTKYVWYRMLFWTVVTVDSIEVGYVVYILTHLPPKLVF